MNCGQFWDAYDSDLSFEERIDFLRTVEYNMSELEDQPCAMVQRFEIRESDTPIEDAFKIAEVFKERFGLVVIEREGSYCKSKYITIMDELDALMRLDDSFSLGMIRYAFKTTGFVYAKDIDPKVLFRLYSNGCYNEFREIPLVKMIEPSPFAEELAEYLFHPDRISKWLETNPDKNVEDYLN